MSSKLTTAAFRKQLMKDAVINNNNIDSPLENPATEKPQKEKTHHCSLCSKLFSSAPALSRHRREQHQLQPKKIYVCPLCKTPAKNKAFYREHLLEWHQTTLEDEKLIFESYLDFTRWKENIENTTKSYFIRSRIVNTENRYDEYYGCHRSGSRHSRQSTIEKESSNRRKQTSKSTSEGLKIGGLCPATIKLHYSEKTKHFEVQYCSTHIGHLLDTDVTVTRRSSARSSDAPAFKKPRKSTAKNLQIRQWRQHLQKTLTSEGGGGSQNSETAANEDHSLSSIILNCAYGCPQVPSVCEHLKPFQVVENNQLNHQNYRLHNHPVDHHYYQVPSAETSLQYQQPPLQNSSSISITTNTTSSNSNEVVIVEEGVVDLTDMATIETLLKCESTTMSDISQHLSSGNTANFQAVQFTSQEPLTNCIKIADLLQHPQLTLLFGDVLQRTNTRNYEYVQRKLQKLLGTLDSLEHIHGSYSKPPEEEEEEEEWISKLSSDTKK